MHNNSVKFAPAYGPARDIGFTSVPYRKRQAINMTAPTIIRNALWKQYEISVDLYKHYLKLAIEINVFYYAITGAIVSYYFAHWSLKSALPLRPNSHEPSACSFLYLWQQNESLLSGRDVLSMRCYWDASGA